MAIPCDNRTGRSRGLGDTPIPRQLPGPCSPEYNHPLAGECRTVEPFQVLTMADKFDPYREALVVENDTVWPEGLAHLTRDERRRIEDRLHADAAHAAELEYVRLPTGFCRRITVTAQDLERLK